MLWLIYMDLVALYKGLVVKTSGHWPLHQSNFAPRMEINIYGRTVPSFNLLAQLLAYIQIWQRSIPIIYCKQFLISREDLGVEQELTNWSQFISIISVLHCISHLLPSFSHKYGHLHRKSENIINQKWTVRLKVMLVQERK